MARVPYVERDALDAEGQRIYDQIRQDRNSPEVGLQFRALLNSPRAAGHLTSMGAELRFHSALPPHLKELAIILVAREWNSGIEWTGHAVLAAQAGVSDGTIEAIRSWQAPEGLKGEEAVVARYIHEAIRNKEITDGTFAAAHQLLGDRGITDLTLTVSYYTALAIAQIALKPGLGGGRVSTL